MVFGFGRFVCCVFIFCWCPLLVYCQNFVFRAFNFWVFVVRSARLSPSRFLFRSRFSVLNSLRSDSGVAISITPLELVGFLRRFLPISEFVGALGVRPVRFFVLEVLHSLVYFFLSSLVISIFVAIRCAPNVRYRRDVWRMYVSDGVIPHECRVELVGFLSISTSPRCFADMRSIPVDSSPMGDWDFCSIRSFRLAVIPALSRAVAPSVFSGAYWFVLFLSFLLAIPYRPHIAALFF